MQTSSDAPDPLLQALSGRGSEVRPAERKLLVGAVAVAHLAALWGLLQIAAVQDAVRQVAPLVVDFITIEPPRPEPTPPPPPAPRPQPRPPPRL